MGVPGLYKKEYIDKQFERRELFATIAEKYGIRSALYPGSFVHVTPSFTIPRVVYVDSFKGAKKFFDDGEAVRVFIEANKEYAEPASYRFIPMDYAKDLPLAGETFDLLISQWAGPISQTCKEYLKPGGILLANNSHADAGLAYLDPDYEFVAVVKANKGRFSISEKNLPEYFIPKKAQKISLESLIGSGKGIAYTKTASSYLFRKRD